MTFTIAITPGEPAGIGPDLCIQLAQQRSLGDPRLVAVADPDLLQARAAQLGLPLRLRDFVAGESGPPAAPRELEVLPIALKAPCFPGRTDPNNAAYVLATLDEAVDGCLARRFDALVTGPVQKSVINEAGTPFTGHTEYLADKCGVAQVVMLLATEGLRVALATTHLPLRRVPAAITPDLLRKVIAILHEDLQAKFGIERPRILVSGLNPHAGECGHLGREEIEIIGPVIAEFKKAGLDINGPLPADTLFTERHLRDADVVLAMYHDQGLPVLKHKGFGRAVNVTLGLPLVRTSVDHGTALDLAGSGRADAGSLATALDYATVMAAHFRPLR